jgi:uncharacterized protein
MLDLSSFRLAPGDVRHEHPRVRVEPIVIAGQTYHVTPPELEPDLELQAASGGLYLKLAFRVHVEGPCFRCLERAELDLRVRASEYQSADPHEPDDELLSDYVDGNQLDLDSWVRDTLVLALPDKILDREDCAGLCARCGQPLEPGVAHECGEPERDTRWDKLRDLL